MEGLLTTKWILEGSGNTVADFTGPNPKQYIHESLPLSEGSEGDSHLNISDRCTEEQNGEEWKGQ